MARREPVTLWTSIGGDFGTLKSPTFKLGDQSPNKLQPAYFEDHETS